VLLFKYYQSKNIRKGVIPENLLKEIVDLEMIIILNNNAAWKNPKNPE